MTIIYTLLFAFGLGFLIKHRGMAVLTYLTLGALLFSYQSLALLLDWLGPNQGFTSTVFDPKPAAFPIESSFGELVSYGVVNLVVFAVGVGLVLLGSRVAARRTAGRDAVAVA